MEVKFMKYCGNCGEKITEGNFFCSRCGTKIQALTPTNENYSNNKHTSTLINSQNSYKQQHTEQPFASKKIQSKVTVKGGRYSGRKWFIKLPYKLYETDVNFSDVALTLAQGTGFIKVKYKTPTKIHYNEIYGVNTQKKFSIPNIIFSAILALLAISMEIPEALIISLISIFVGKTAIVSIRHSSGIYIVPTEFISEAVELQDKINTAIRQSTT